MRRSRIGDQGSSEAASEFGLSLEPGAQDTQPGGASLKARVGQAVQRRAEAYGSPYLDSGYMMQFQEIERAVAEQLRRLTGGRLAGRKILDVGCGAGDGCASS
jgi:hypothetical protein